MFNVVVLAVIKRGDKYLLTKRVHLDSEDDTSFKDKWEVPGGGLEIGEQIEEALHREVMEELGIEVDVQTILPSVFCRYYKERNWNGVFISYLCTMVNEKDEIKLNEENSDYGWYTIEQVKKLKRLPLTYELLQSAEEIFLM